MKQITQIVDNVIRDGKPLNIVRNSFICDDSVNWLARAQSHFTLSQKKEAKFNYKNNMSVKLN